MMHEPEKSDSAVVATKPANKAGQLVAEPVERRAGTGRNANQQSTCRAQNRGSVSQALGRVRQAAPIPGAAGARGAVKQRPKSVVWEIRTPRSIGRTRSKRIADASARNQCLGARSLGQTLKSASPPPREVGRGASLLTEVLPSNQIEDKLFGCLANQPLRHLVELTMPISEYHLIC